MSLYMAQTMTGGYIVLYLYIGDHRHAAARRGGDVRLTVYITIFSKYTAAADKIGGTALSRIHGEISTAQIPTFNFKPEAQLRPTHSPLHISPTPSFSPSIEISSKASSTVASRKSQYSNSDTLPPPAKYFFATPSGGEIQCCISGLCNIGGYISIFYNGQRPGQAPSCLSTLTQYFHLNLYSFFCEIFLFFYL